MNKHISKNGSRQKDNKCDTSSLTHYTSTTQSSELSQDKSLLDSKTKTHKKSRARGNFKRLTFESERSFEEPE